MSGKAGRLLEIFSLLTFPVFQPSRYFDGQNCAKKFLSFRMSKIFTKLTKNLTEKPKYTGKCQKCQKYTGIFDIRRDMSKITSEPSIKWPKFDQ